MGYNTTVVVLNDAIGEIERDPEFGKNLGAAIRDLHTSRRLGRGRVDVRAGCHGNAASVIESHHADETAIVTVGGNCGIAHVLRHGWDHHTPEGQRRLLERWAHSMGLKVMERDAATQGG